MKDDPKHCQKVIPDLADPTVIQLPRKFPSKILNATLRHFRRAAYMSYER